MSAPASAAPNYPSARKMPRPRKLDRPRCWVVMLDGKPAVIELHPNGTIYARRKRQRKGRLCLSLASMFRALYHEPPPALEQLPLM